MATGYAQNGVDFDALFDPDTIGDGPAAPVFARNGAPARYAARKYGSKRADVGYKQNGVDVSNLWAAKGTATQSVVIGFGQYMATSSGSHDSGATFGLTVRTDGTWGITLTQLQGGGTSGAPLSGAWHRTPTASVGAGYEIRFTASVTIADNYEPGAMGSYTASTGWLSLASDRSVSATTGHLLSGGAGSGTVNVGGSYTVEIRRTGSTGAVVSVCHFEVEAVSV